jgi:drug/metabolite transporter (DMT)-like permease
MLIFLGICGFVMQFLLTKGLAAGGKGNSKSVQMIYTNMLFALALDKLVFGQSPGWWSLAGSGLILGSAVFVAVQKQQSSVTSADGVEDDEETNGGSIQYGEADMGQELRYIRP